MQPVFARRAKALMYEFVFGDEQTRTDAKRDINSDVKRGRRLPAEPSLTGKYGQRIERMPQPFPTRQSAPPVKVKLVYAQRQHVQHERQQQPPRTQHFSKSVPAIVSPGPKARLTISVPDLIVSSLSTRSHT